MTPRRLQVSAWVMGTLSRWYVTEIGELAQLWKWRMQHLVTLKDNPLLELQWQRESSLVCAWWNNLNVIYTQGLSSAYDRLAVQDVDVCIYFRKAFSWPVSCSSEMLRGRKCVCACGQGGWLVAQLLKHLIFADIKVIVTKETKALEKDMVFGIIWNASIIIVRDQFKYTGLEIRQLCDLFFVEFAVQFQYSLLLLCKICAYISLFVKQDKL